MVKTLGNIKSTRPKKNKVKVGGKNKVEVDSRNKFVDDEIGNNKIDDNEVSEIKNYWKTFKSKKTISFITLDFFTSRTRLVFTKLR